jgi:hypothetical protein
MKQILLRKQQQQEELNAVTDAMRQAEQTRLVTARAFHEKRAHDLLSQAQSRMEGTMIDPQDKATALDRVKGVGEFGVVRQFPSPSTEVPVGSGFVLAAGGGGGGGIARAAPAVARPPDERSGRRMVPPPKVAVEKPGKRLFTQPKTSLF